MSRIDHGSTYKCSICDVECYSPDHCFPEKWDSLYIYSDRFIYSDSDKPLKRSFDVCEKCCPSFFSIKNDDEPKKQATDKTIKNIFSWFVKDNNNET